MFNGPVLRLKANLLSPSADYSLDFGAFFWNSCSFMASPMLPCTFSLPWKNAFCEFSFPVIRSTRSPSDMVRVTSGFAAKKMSEFQYSSLDSHPDFSPLPLNSTEPSPFLASTIQNPSLFSGPPFTLNP